jgi:hypothetical protein
VQSEPMLLPSNPCQTAHRFPTRTSFSCQIRLFKHPLRVVIKSLIELARKLAVFSYFLGEVILLT